MSDATMGTVKKRLQEFGGTVVDKKTDVSVGVVVPSRSGSSEGCLMWSSLEAYLSDLSGTVPRPAVLARHKWEPEVDKRARAASGNFALSKEYFVAVLAYLLNVS